MFKKMGPSGPIFFGYIRYFSPICPVYDHSLTMSAVHKSSLHFIVAISQQFGDKTVYLRLANYF